jgi:hypothetical protein
MDQPMFVFAGAYRDLASAEGDYEVISLLHSCDEIGSYDAAVITKASDGTVAVRKTYESVLPGLRLADPSGAELEAWLGHLGHTVAAADAEEIGAVLGEDRAALVVVGSDADAARIEQTAVEATRAILKRLT